MSNPKMPQWCYLQFKQKEEEINRLKSELAKEREVVDNIVSWAEPMAEEEPEVFKLARRRQKERVG